MNTYLVGGAVRDALLGLPVSDRDWVVTGATPQTLLDAGYRPVGRDFPVFLHPDSHEEYALARTERKCDHGYHGFEFDTDPGVTLEQDLSRRDLTINAIAQKADGTLVDPYHGQADLQQRWLRHVSPAFAEDPLRVLRVARFAARLSHLGFRIHPDTLALMQQIVASDELEHLPAERLWQELSAALASRTPARFVLSLRECGALLRVLPEVDRLFGVPQSEKWHPEIDTGMHSLMVLEQAAELTAHDSATRDDDPAHDTDAAGVETRFAALCHDLGKGTTPADLRPAHHGHEERGAQMLEPLCQRLRVPKRHQQLAILSARWHTHCHRIDELKITTIHQLLLALDVLRKPARFEQFVSVCLADDRGRLGREHSHYPQAGQIRRLGKALMSVNAGQIAAATDDQSQIPERIREAQLQALRACRTAPQG